MNQGWKYLFFADFMYYRIVIVENTRAQYFDNLIWKLCASILNNGYTVKHQVSHYNVLFLATFSEFILFLCICVFVCFFFLFFFFVCFFLCVFFCFVCLFVCFLLLFLGFFCIFFFFFFFCQNNKMEIDYNLSIWKGVFHYNFFILT